jgi:hypothetical protein
METGKYLLLKRNFVMGPIKYFMVSQRREKILQGIEAEAALSHNSVCTQSQTFSVWLEHHVLN